MKRWDLMLKKFIRECRPATLVVTIMSTTLGVVAAYREGYIFQDILWDIWRIFLVTAAGILLQSGMNLINNFFEEEDEADTMQRKWKLLLFKTGMMFFIATAIIGLYLSFHSGIQLLIIEFVGIFSAYAYAGYPINYKKYGLGVVMSFVMMGPLMVYAAFFVFSKTFSMYPILYSFTMSLFIPAVLLGNELRDYEEDKRKGIGTLTVRIGFYRGKVLYYCLIALAYINILLLIICKLLSPLALVVFSTIPLIIGILNAMRKNKRLLIPATAKLYLIYGLQFLIILIITK
jgi:1,4-dihydroxy-2-naphthoate octaprenyltransferase